MNFVIIAFSTTKTVGSVETKSISVCARHASKLKRRCAPPMIAVIIRVHFNVIRRHRNELFLRPTRPLIYRLFPVLQTLQNISSASNAPAERNKNKSPDKTYVIVLRSRNTYCTQFKSRQSWNVTFYSPEDFAGAQQN